MFLYNYPEEPCSSAQFYSGQVCAFSTWIQAKHACNYAAEVTREFSSLTLLVGRQEERLACKNIE